MTLAIRPMMWACVFALGLTACDPDDELPLPRSAATCAGDSECQDMSYCNGWEICDPSDPYGDERGCIKGLACGVVRNVVRREEILDGDSTAPAYRECEEALYQLAIFQTCSYREGKPRPSRASTLDERFCESPQRDDYAVQCHAWADRYCVADEDCDDSVFCNGVERCVPHAAAADARGCLAQRAPVCPEDSLCDEELEACVMDCEDEDGDGRYAAACGGDDCDDQNPDVFPGASEVCDDVDDDCDPSTLGTLDADGDGFVSSTCSNPDGGERITGPDCDDADPNIHPIAPEVCNGIDDDCNGVVDEGLLIPMYVDSDGDGFGEGDKPVASLCAGSPGHSPISGDCDADNPQLFPGSIRCADLGPNQPGAMETCMDGAWQGASCPNNQVCHAQPTGAGVCLP